MYEEPPSLGPLSWAVKDICFADKLCKSFDSNKRYNIFAHFAISLYPQEHVRYASFCEQHGALYLNFLPQTLHRTEVTLVLRVRVLFPIRTVSLLFQLRYPLMLCLFAVILSTTFLTYPSGRPFLAIGVLCIEF